MEIKNGKDWTAMHILKIPALAFLLYEGFQLPHNHVIIFCLWLIFAVLFVGYDIDLLRKLVLDEKGCTVIIGWYKKFYAWDDLKTKRLVLNPKDRLRLSKGLPVYKRCVFFSPQENVVFKTLGPYKYMKLFHPISCFCLHFNGDKISGYIDNLEIFEVNEEELKSKFEEWGVKVEGFTD